MRRVLPRLVMTAAIAMVFPLTVSAQDASVPADSSSLSAPVTFQPAAPRTKRRGSMVGYIEDATIRTELRVRFDAGWGVDSPDRAEFFYAKCGCYRDLAGSPLLDPDAPGPGPGIVTKLGYQQFNIQASYAVSTRFAIFGELPFRFLSPKGFVSGTGSFDSQGGLGDITAGAKISLFTDDTRDITLLVRGSFPSGDALKGLGTDHGSFEPAFLYRQDLSARASLESQFGLLSPIGGARGPLASDDDFSGNVIYYGIGPSFDAFDNGKVRFSPVVELVGWHVVNGFDTTTLVADGVGKADGTNIVNLKFGARTSFNSGSLYAGVGFGLTDAKWYDKMFRIEYRAGF